MNLPDKDYDLANIIQASRALERSEAELKAFRWHVFRVCLGWAVVLFTFAAAIYEHFNL